jgi:hypothetical protein
VASSASVSKSVAGSLCIRDPIASIILSNICRLIGSIAAKAGSSSYPSMAVMPPPGVALISTAQ